MVAANLDHLVIGIETALPFDEFASQVGEVEVVLQACLEIVRGQQIHQVISFRRRGQGAQANDPVLVLANLLADQCRDELSFPDALDRLIKFVDLHAECVERTPVVNSRAAVHVEPAIRIGQREHGFLRGAVSDLAISKNAPGHNGPLNIVHRHVGPTGTEQRLVREWPVKTHTIEIRDSAFEFLCFEVNRTGDKIRLVPNGQFRRIVRHDAAGLT